MQANSISARISGHSMVAQSMPSRRVSHRASPPSRHATAGLAPRAPGDLANRAQFELAVTKCIAAGGGTAVLMFSIDDLPRITDQFGEVVGRDVIEQFASRVRRLEPFAASVARLADNQCAMLLSGLSAASNAEAIALRFLRALEAPFLVGPGAVHVRASIGIALAPVHATDTWDLMDAASCALAEATQAGGDVWRVSRRVAPPLTAPARCMSASAPVAQAAPVSVSRAAKRRARPFLGRLSTGAKYALLGAAAAVLMHAAAAAQGMELSARLAAPLDPLFNLPYNPAEIHFAPVALSQFGDCQPLLGQLGKATGEVKLFGQSVGQDRQIYLIGDENPRAPRGLSGTLLVVDHGACRTAGPLFALRRTPVGDPDLDPRLSEADVASLLADTFNRYASAFGGKANFLTWADRLTAERQAEYDNSPAMPCPLPFTRLFTPQMRRALDAFRGA